MKLFVVSEKFYSHPYDGDYLVQLIAAPDLSVAKKVATFSVRTDDFILFPFHDYMELGGFTPNSEYLAAQAEYPEYSTGGFSLTSESVTGNQFSDEEAEFRFNTAEKLGRDGYLKYMAECRCRYFSRTPKEGWEYVSERHGDFEIPYYVSPEWVELIKGKE